MVLKTSILPTNQTFVKIPNKTQKLHLEAICVFLATGFFLEGDSYWENELCLPSGSTHTLDANGLLINSKPWFNWHYTPRDITFENALEEYIALLTSIMEEQLGDSPVILPLSGGLDSRSQAMVLKHLKKPVRAFSYSFQNGFPEDKIAKKIANVCGFDFEAFKIEPGYLWNSIDELAQINGCLSEFTHPRQMAILPELKNMDGVFSLGHWGDVLFDRGAPEGTTSSDIIPLLMKKMIKPKGLLLAEELWKEWQLDGDFNSYLVERIKNTLEKIKIDNVSAKVRAFKTSQWAHRWTTTNLSIFEAAHPITLPYYDDRMCEFICTIPETYLADRRLQLAHLSMDKTLANITWQDHKPFNIINYKFNKIPFNLPFRVLNKLKRETNSFLGKPLIQRNWELQFVGSNNEKALESYIFNTDFNHWIPKSIVQNFYTHFKNTDAINYAHPISMLLTLSLWHKQNKTHF